MKLSLAPTLLAGALSVIAYLAWSSSTGSSLDASAAEPTGEKLTRASMQPVLRFKLHTDPFRMPVVASKITEASPLLNAENLFVGPPTPAELAILDAATDAAAVLAAASTTGASTPTDPQASPTTDAASTALASTQAAAADAATAETPRVRQDGDPIALDAILMAGEFGTAVIDGRVRLKGQPWSTAAGSARLTKVEFDHVVIDLEGHTIELQFTPRAPASPTRSLTTKPRRDTRS